MNRRSFLHRLGLLAAAPVVVGWSRSLEGVWYPDDGQWVPIRRASKDFTMVDILEYMDEVMRRSSGWHQGYVYHKSWSAA